jgi:DNA-directed RNA polymerase subunit M/transcription elongation factor TFIIS
LYILKTDLVKFCPECGGDLKMDSSTRNFICKSCGLYASRDKIEELKDKSQISSSESKQRTHDDYLDLDIKRILWFFHSFLFVMRSSVLLF